MGKEQAATPTTNPRQRGHCAAINHRLISSAGSGDVNALLNTIERDLSRMNLVNMSTALHRLAKLKTRRPQASELHRKKVAIEALVDALDEQLSHRQQLHSPQPQALSNIAWALATLRRIDVPLAEKLVAHASKYLDSFKPFELSAILWAYATFDSIDPAACEVGEPLFVAAAARLPGNLENFSFQCLVMIVWAFATTDHHDKTLLATIADKMAGLVHKVSNQDLGNAAWAFSRSGYYPNWLCADIVPKWSMDQGSAPVLPPGQVVKKPSTFPAFLPGPAVTPDVRRVGSDCSTGAGSSGSGDDSRALSPSVETMSLPKWICPEKLKSWQPEGEYVKWANEFDGGYPGWVEEPFGAGHQGPHASHSYLPDEPSYISLGALSNSGHTPWPPARCIFSA